MKAYIPAVLILSALLAGGSVARAQTIPYPYSVVSVDASPLVVRDESLVRVSWSSVWANPYDTWSPDAYRGQEHHCTLNGRQVAGSGYTDVPVYGNTTFTISCGGEVERGKCRDELPYSARPDLGPDSVCRSMEKKNDDVKDGRSQGPSIYGKFHLHSESVTVTTNYPESPLIATCQVSPTAPQVESDVTWSVTAEGGKAVYFTNRWEITQETCINAENLPTCGSEVSYRNSCEAPGEACITDAVREACQSSGLLQETPTVEQPSLLDNPIYQSRLVPIYQSRLVDVYACTEQGAYGTNYSYSWSGTDGLIGNTASLIATYSTPGLKEGTVAVQAAAGQVIRTCQVTVGGGAADLTTSSVTPTTATAGIPVTLSATATNLGGLTTQSFPILFQFQSPDALRNSSYLSGLAPSTSSTGSVAHTFSSAGVYQVRACANFNTAWAAIASESDYANNCGPWTSITVSPAMSTSLSCTASQTSVSVGGSVTYSVSGGSAPYTWTAPDGGTYGSSATVTRTFPSDGNYGMTVSKSGFTSGSCPVIAVGAASGACTNPVATITAAPDRIRPGTSTSLSYTASGIESSCTISGPGVSEAVAAASCVVPGGTISTPNLTTQATYTITCDGVERDRVVVNVVPNFEEF